MGLARRLFGQERRACSPVATGRLAVTRLDAEIVRKLIRTVAADLSALEEAAALRRRQIPGPVRMLDPLNEALERTRVRILGGLNDLRAALEFARTREAVGTREFTRMATAKMASAQAELEALTLRAPADLAVLEPAESVMEYVVVALRAIESTGAELQAHLA